LSNSLTYDASKEKCKRENEKMMVVVGLSVKTKMKETVAVVALFAKIKRIGCCDWM